MKNKIKFLISSLVLVLILGACGQEETNETRGIEENTNVSQENEDQENETQQEEATPEPQIQEDVQEEEPEYPDYVDLDLVDKDGNPVKLSDYEGKFIALNFFGTWCTYCMQEMPDLQKVYSEYEGDDFVIVLLNATTTEQITPEEVGQWYEDGGYTMPMMMDLDGVALETYPVQGFPTTYFINKEGKVLGAVSGMLDEATLLSIIETYK